MILEPAEHERLAAFVHGLSRGSARDLRLRVQPLRGGLEAGSVYRVSARFADEFGKRRSFRFVVKHVHGSLAREARIYEALLQTNLRAMVPSLLGLARAKGRPTHLYLEAVTQDVRWPWTNQAIVRRLLEKLADLHAPEHVQALGAHVSDWDYSADLRVLAAETVELAERAGLTAQQERASLSALRRLADNLEHIRRQIAGVDSLPLALLHGDLHPGNVVVRFRSGENEPIFIDWARARCGSPLEDVSSWLQSLGYWEPAVRRRHYTLLGAYMRARGLPAQPSRELRDAYWLASAMNCFGGAMKYHLEVASASWLAPRTRFAAQQAIAHYLRLAQRADECWRA